MALELEKAFPVKDGLKTQSVFGKAVLPRAFLKSSEMHRNAGCCPQTRRFSAGILCGFQGKSTQYGDGRQFYGHFVTFQKRPNAFDWKEGFGRGCPNRGQ